MRVLLSSVLLAAIPLAQASSPDLVIINARALPACDSISPRASAGATSGPWVEAVSVKGDRIAAIGTTAEVVKTAGSATRTIDAGARAPTPGPHGRRPAANTP